MNKIISLFVLFPFLFFNVLCFGQTISPMDKGQKAPFEGILYSLGADKDRELKILNLELKLKEFNIDKKEEISKLKIEHEAEIAILNVEIEENLKREKDRLKIKNEQIDFLEKQLIENTKSQDWKLWVGIIVGAVSTAVAFALSVWAVAELDSSVEMN